MPSNERYSTNKFYEDLEQVKKILEDISFMVINGGAMHFYINILLDCGLEILDYRIPTDLDIAVQTDLETLKKYLTEKSIPFDLETEPVNLWGLQYTAPCIVLDFDGEKINLLPESWIIKENGSQCRINFSEVRPFRYSKLDINLLPLAAIRVIKEFQQRGRPKTDDLDLEEIMKVIKYTPGLFFDQKEYETLAQRAIS